MEKKQVTVMVHLKTKKGMGTRLKKAALGLIPKTRQEAGCINYYFHVDEKDPDLFMFYENWMSHKDLDEHLEMPYLQEFQKLLTEVLAEREEFKIWKIAE
jgi:quinol monooxygenase YgiN